LYLQARTNHFGLAFLFQPVTFATDVDEPWSGAAPVHGGESHDGIAGEERR